MAVYYRWDTNHGVYYRWDTNPSNAHVHIWNTLFQWSLYFLQCQNLVEKKFRAIPNTGWPCSIKYQLVQSSFNTSWHILIDMILLDEMSDYSERLEEKVQISIEKPGFSSRGWRLMLCGVLPAELGENR